MSSITINKLLKTTHNADSESGKSYQGVVTATAMKEIASNLDMSYNNYYEEMRAAISTYLTLPGFYYKLEPEFLNVWKSQPESIPILFLEICIKEIRSKNELLDSAIELLQKQDKSLTDRVQKAHKYDEHSRELLNDFRLCVEEKNELEKTLLKKFAVLLNAKKDRIAKLEDRLKNYEKLDNNHDNTDSEENEEIAHSSKRRRFINSESESDDEYNAETQPLTVTKEQTNNNGRVFTNN